MLVGTRDFRPLDRSDLVVASERQPDPAELEELLFAWRCVKHVKSNGIVITRDRAIRGVGAGQQNRVRSVRLAVEQAGELREGRRAGVRRLLPVPRRPGSRRQGGRHGDDPARRLGQGRRDDRPLRRVGDRARSDRRPAFPALSRASVSVPATSANLGSGFDTVGVALEWRNVFHVEARQPGVEIELVAGALVLPGDSLAHRAAKTLYDSLELPCPPLSIQTEAKRPVQPGTGKLPRRRWSADSSGRTRFSATRSTASSFSRSRWRSRGIRTTSRRPCSVAFRSPSARTTARSRASRFRRLAGLRAVVCVPERLVPYRRRPKSSSRRLDPRGDGR